MDIIYKKEHMECPNYQVTLPHSIEVKEITDKQGFDEPSPHCRIVITLEGGLSYLLDEGDLKNRGRMKERQILLLPPNRAFKLTTSRRSKLLIIQLKEVLRFCEGYSIEKLTHQTDDLFLGSEEKSKQKSHLLSVNEGLESYLSGVLLCISKGFYCKSFFDLKIKEFFYLLRAFYTKEKLALFFREILSADTCFSSFVICNHHKYNTVSKLSAAANMTPWSFEKQFKKVFSMPAYQWMKEHKAKGIYQAICTERTPLKELAIRFGFSSKSSFSEFCRKNIGETPGQLRRNTLLDKHKEQNQRNA